MNVRKALSAGSAHEGEKDPDEPARNDSGKPGQKKSPAALPRPGVKPTLVSFAVLLANGTRQQWPLHYDNSRKHYPALHLPHTRNSLSSFFGRSKQVWSSIAFDH